ncbi:hypothetical protein BDZ91DRAFT_702946 [Kalaharituber pfeilii]|nr:hypothetical protein BDZ91DRAFT_702946 [Kalaharituber pfeilii]
MLSSYVQAFCLSPIIFLLINYVYKHLLFHLFATHERPLITPVSVNFHFARTCNFSCGFCFHTAKTSHVPTISEAQRALTLLKAAGMRKLNFAGGEPFLHPRWLSLMLRFAKHEIQLESVSIVTNGSKVTEAFLKSHAGCIDILAVSCDSFNEETNMKIGRGLGDRSGYAHLETVKRIAGWCRKYGIMFKLNTVVNRYNVNEDMNEAIQIIAPFRWKCFQVLLVPGENNSSPQITEKPLRDASTFAITDDEFAAFCGRHSHNACFVPESSKVMSRSYLILDEYLRFVDRGAPTASILEVGVQKALMEVGWDEEGFLKRGGMYEWNKEKAMGARHVGKENSIVCGDRAFGGNDGRDVAELEW